jgi:hypothetical protein
MKKLLFSLLALGLVGLSPTISSQVSLSPTVQAAAQATEPLTLDVACDCRTYRLNRVDPANTSPLADGGDTFVIRGKIFPGGAIPAGGTPNNPSPFGPDSPGSIGDWYCRGVYIVSDAEAAAGAQPVASVTQHYLLNEFKDSLVIEQTIIDYGPTADQVLTGGLGKYGGVTGTGQVEIFGVNPTGCPNFRTTFTLK